MEVIKLSDLLGACLEFTQDPTKKNELVYKEIVSRFVVANYVSLTQKQVAMITILNQCTTKDNDAITAEINLTVSKTIYGLLSYVVNLENDLEFGAFDAGAIDMLYSLGIVDDVLKFCETDYKRLEQMVDQAVNFSNLVRLSELAKYMAPDNIDTFIQTVKDMKTELTPERLSELKTICATSSPEWVALKQTITEEVVGKIMDYDFAELGPNKVKKSVKKEEDSKISEEEFVESDKEEIQEEQ